MKSLLEVVLLCAVVVSINASVVVQSDIPEAMVNEGEEQIPSQSRGLIHILRWKRPFIFQDRSHCPPDEEFACDLPCRERCDRNKCMKNRIHDKCEPKCYCKADSVRINDRCVERREGCHESCDEPNTSWRIGNSCTDRCNPHERVCSPHKKKHCYCNEGYARIEGACYEKEYCNCGANKVFRSCGDPCKQQCPYPPTGCLPPVSCLVGCFCADNFVLTANGTCLSPVDAGCLMPTTEGTTATTQSTTLSTTHATTTSAALLFLNSGFSSEEENISIQE